MTYESLNSEFRLRVLKTEEDRNEAEDFWQRHMPGATASQRTSSRSIEYWEVLLVLIKKYDHEKLWEEGEE